MKHQQIHHHMFKKIFKIDPSETEAGKGGTVEKILGFDMGQLLTLQIGLRYE